MNANGTFKIGFYCILYDLFVALLYVSRRNTGNYLLLLEGPAPNDGGPVA